MHINPATWFVKTTKKYFSQTTDSRALHMRNKSFIVYLLGVCQLTTVYFILVKDWPLRRWQKEEGQHGVCNLDHQISKKLQLYRTKRFPK